MGERSFSSEAGLRAAIRKQGLHLIPYEIVRLDTRDNPGGKRVNAKFTTELVEDRDYICGLGFRAEVAKVTR